MSNYKKIDDEGNVVGRFSFNIIKKYSKLVRIIISLFIIFIIGLVILGIYKFQYKSNIKQDTTISFIQEPNPPRFINFISKALDLNGIYFSNPKTTDEVRDSARAAQRFSNPVLEEEYYVMLKDSKNLIKNDDIYHADYLMYIGKYAEAKDIYYNIYLNNKNTAIGIDAIMQAFVISGRYLNDASTACYYYTRLRIDGGTATSGYSGYAGRLFDYLKYDCHIYPIEERDQYGK